MTDIKSMTLEELTQTLREMGQPAFRGGQVFTWLHRGVTSFEEMSDLPRALREQLAQTFHITCLLYTSPPSWGGGRCPLPLHPGGGVPPDGGGGRVSGVCRVRR